MRPGDLGGHSAGVLQHLAIGAARAARAPTRIFRAANRGDEKGGTRTAAELCASAEARREAREEAQRARERKAQQAKSREEQRREDELARDIDGAWRRLEELVAASSYEEAMKLAKDLRNLATRKGEPESFRARFDELRKRQSRRRGFFDRWKRAERSRDALA